MKIPAKERALNQKNYVITSALRGPDYRIPRQPLSILKWELTCRIRALCYPNYRIRGFYNSECLTHHEFRLVCNALNDLTALRFLHYKYHLAEAIQQTMTHPIWGGFGPRLYDLLKGA